MALCGYPNLTLLPIAPLMLVKEPSDLALKLSCVVQLAYRNGVFKKFALNSRRQIVPLHNDCGAQTPQNMLLFLGEGSHVVASFLRCALCSASTGAPRARPIKACKFCQDLCQVMSDGKIGPLLFPI
jgi:hypothetical protein